MTNDLKPQNFLEENIGAMLQISAIFFWMSPQARQATVKISK